MEVVQKQIRQKKLLEVGLLKNQNNFMARARRKFLYVTTSILSNVLIKKYTKKLPRKISQIFKKNSTIPKSYLYLRVKIHKGNLNITKTVTKWMIGKKFGEFVLTRKPFFFPIKKTSKKKIRR